MADKYIGMPMFDGLGLEPQVVNPDPVVPAGSRQDYRSKALEALRTLAANRQLITADDLYDVIDVRPDSPSQAGAVWVAAVAEGIITGTDLMRRSKRPEAHGRKIPVYASVLYEPGSGQVH